MSNPITLIAPTTYFAPTLNGGRDYIIKCPTGMRTSDMVLSGNPKNPPRNIVLIDCRSQGQLLIQYFTGIAHIEGTYWAPPHERDGIDCGGPLAPSGRCRIQVTRIEGLYGSYNGTHADCVQPWGYIASLQIDRMTCDTNYQGIFLGQPEWVGYAELSKVNISHNAMPSPDGHPGILFWVGNTDQHHTNGIKPVYLKFSCIMCFAKVRSDLSFMNDAVYPGPGSTLFWKSVAPITVDNGASLCWPAALNTQDTSAYALANPCKAVIKGDPYQGDYAPASLKYYYLPG